MTTPLTPAEFALGEVRFKKQFKKLAPDLEASALPMDEYVELPRTGRVGRIPFVYATDDDRHLIKVACSDAIVALVEDRRRYWQTLQYLSGVHEAQLTALHRADFDALTTLYEQATQQRESSLDEIAKAMSELATSSKAPIGMGFGGSGGAVRRSGPGAAAAASRRPSRSSMLRCGSTPSTSRSATTAARAIRSCPSSSRRPRWSSTALPGRLPR